MRITLRVRQISVQIQSYKNKKGKNNLTSSIGIKRVHCSQVLLIECSIKAEILPVFCCGILRCVLTQCHSLSRSGCPSKFTLKFMTVQLEKHGRILEGLPGENIFSLRHHSLGLQTCISPNHKTWATTSFDWRHPIGGVWHNARRHVCHKYLLHAVNRGGGMMIRARFAATASGNIAVSDSSMNSSV